MLLLCTEFVVSFKCLDVLLIAHPLATIYFISFLLLFDLAQLKQRHASQVHQNNLYGSLGHINRVHEPHGFNYEEQYLVRHWKGKRRLFYATARMSHDDYLLRLLSKEICHQDIAV